MGLQYAICLVAAFQAFLDIIVAAADANVILVCAAGNSGSDNDGFPLIHPAMRLKCDSSCSDR